MWFAVGHYLAHACLNLTLIGCPEKIVIDDGVMNRDIILFTITRQQFAKLLNQFLQHPKIQGTSNINIYIYIYIYVYNYIIPSKHFPNNGLMSAMLLGQEYGK